MKRLSIIAIAFAALGVFIAGCEKKAEKIADFSFSPTTQAQLKVNYASSYFANPGIQLKLDTTRISGLITGRTPYPGGGFNTNGQNFPDYLEVTPGTMNLSGSIPKKNTAIDSVALFTKSIKLEAGKNYTAHVTDTGANTQVLLLQDDVTPADTGKAKYRFVNLMPNVPAIDLYFGTTIMASNVAYLSATPYFTMPVTGVTAQSWTIRPAGSPSTSTALATYASTNTILSTRVYTIFAMGYNIPSTDTRYATLKPYVSFLLNR